MEGQNQYQRALKKKIINAVKINRDLTAAEVQKNEDLNHKNVHVSTIERLLNNAGLKA